MQCAFVVDVPRQFRVDSLKEWPFVVDVPRQFAVATFFGQCYISPRPFAFFAKCWPFAPNMGCWSLKSPRGAASRRLDWRSRNRERGGRHFFAMAVHG